MKNYLVDTCLGMERVFECETTPSEEIIRTFEKDNSDIVIEKTNIITPSLELPRGFTFCEIGKYGVNRISVLQRIKICDGGLRVLWRDVYIQQCENLVGINKETRKKELITYRHGPWLYDGPLTTYDKHFQNKEYFFLSQEGFEKFKKYRKDNPKIRRRNDPNIPDPELIWGL